jgi:hypothetical protein
LAEREGGRRWARGGWLDFGDAVYGR